MSLLCNEIPSKGGCIEKLYRCLCLNGNLDGFRVPHSDVFFVRAALEDRFCKCFTLNEVEKYMKEEINWCK